MASRPFIISVSSSISSTQGIHTEHSCSPHHEMFVRNLLSSRGGTSPQPFPFHRKEARQCSALSVSRRTLIGNPMGPILSACGERSSASCIACAHLVTGQKRPPKKHERFRLPTLAVCSSRWADVQLRNASATGHPGALKRSSGYDAAGEEMNSNAPSIAHKRTFRYRPNERPPRARCFVLVLLHRGAFKTSSMHPPDPTSC